MIINRRIIHMILSDIPTEQNREELLWLAKKVEELKPQIIVELGVRRGGTLKIWDLILSKAKDPFLLAIDMENKLIWNTSTNAACGNIKFIQADLREESTVECVKELMGNRKIDFLFHDADHGYDAAKNDFNNFLPLVRDGGIIAFHDINFEKDQVGKFWRELQGKKEEMMLGQGTGIFYVS